MKQYIDKSALVAEIERLKGIRKKEVCLSQYALSGYLCACVDILSFINTLEVKEVQEEPVSEDLEEASRNYADDEEYGDDVYYAIKAAFKEGAKWQIENFWKPADGNDLPEIDREVIVLVGIKNPVTTDSIWGCEVAFAHRPNPDGWDGKSITTGKVEHYDVQTYGKGGWNIPDVKFWLDCELPKMEE